MSNERSMTASNFADVIQQIHRTHSELSAHANKAINVSLTLHNWLIGLHIVEYEQGGADRAQYGTQLLDKVSVELDRLNIPRCEARELRRYRQFYQLYPQIQESQTHELAKRIPAASNLGVSDSQIDRANMMTEGDNPPIGIFLCTDKNHALAEYALAGRDNQLFVSRYQLELPKKEDMQRFIDEQLQSLDAGQQHE